MGVERPCRSPGRRRLTQGKFSRKPIILAGMLLAVVTYFPLFNMLTNAANPDLAAAQVKNKIVVSAAPGDCSFQGNPVAREIDFTKPCDIAKRRLAQNSVSYGNGTATETDPAKVDKITIIVILSILVIYVIMVYGPIAAMLAELFPTRIHHTAMSLNYHIGNRWFGGLMPTIAFAVVAQNSRVYYGLRYPIVIASITFAVDLLFVR